MGHTPSGRLVRVKLLPFDLPVSPGPRTVLLSRHGRTVANERKVHQSWDEWGLSRSGLQNALAARGWWTQRDVARVISSPLRRPLQTARAVLGRVDLLDAGWAEIASPGVVGMTTAEAYQRVPHLYGEDGWPVRHADGGADVETTSVLLERAQHALRRSAEAVPPGRTVAVFSHGACVAYLAQAGGLELPTVANLGVLELLVDPARGWGVVALHDPLAGTSTSRPAVGRPV